MPEERKQPSGLGDNVALLEKAKAQMKVCDDNYDTNVKKRLEEAEKVYSADKKYYQSKWPKLSSKNDFVTHDMWALIEWMMPQFTAAFCGNDSVVAVRPVETNDGPKADAMRKLIHHQVFNQNSGHVVTRHWMQTACKSNVGFIKVWWDRQIVEEEHEAYLGPMEVSAFQSSLGPQDSILELTENEDESVYVRWSRPITLKNQPVIEYVSPAEVRFLPWCRRFDDTEFVAHTPVKTISDLRKLEAEGVYQDVDSVVANLEDPEYDDLLTLYNPALESVNGNAEVGPDTRVRVNECYMLYDLDGDGQMEPLIVTYCCDTLLRVEPNDIGRPLVFSITPFSDPEKLYASVSLSDVAGEIQAMKTAVLRQTLYNTSLVNDPRNFIDQTKVNMSDLLEDSQWIRTNGPPREVLSPVNTAQVAPYTVSLLDRLDAQFENETSKSKWSSGQPDMSLNHAATGAITSIIDTGTQRIDGMKRELAETGWRPLYKTLVAMNQRYIDDETMIRVGEAPMTVDPMDIDGEYDISIDSALGVGDKGEITQILQVFLQQMFPSAMQLGVAGPREFIRASRKLLELSGLRNSKEYLPYESAEEMMMAYGLGTAVGPPVGGPGMAGGAPPGPQDGNPE